MKQILNRRMALVAALSVCLTVLLTSCIFYGKYQAQIHDDLKMNACILLATQEFLSCVEQKYDPGIDNLRITVIAVDGGVEYDSNADIGHMDNHGDRPEIRQAFVKGEGYEVRRSGTLDKNTYYYARRLDDGRVLRIAREAGSLWRTTGIRRIRAGWRWARCWWCWPWRPLASCWPVFLPGR